MTSIALAREGRDALLRAADPSKATTMIYRLRCPYILCDAHLWADYEGAEPGGIRLAISFDEGKRWSEVWKNADRPSRINQGFLLDVSARYAYWLRLSIDGNATIRDLRLRTTFVASPLALPGKLALGTNRVEFVASEGIGPVRVVCRWSERHKSGESLSSNTLSHYLDDDRTQRNVLVVKPGAIVPLRINPGTNSASPSGRETLRPESVSGSALLSPALPMIVERPREPRIPAVSAGIRGEGRSLAAPVSIRGEGASPDRERRVWLTGVTGGLFIGRPSTARDGSIEMPIKAPEFPDSQ